jgi:hypothetical protein
MKKIHIYLLALLVFGSLFFSSCKEDSPEVTKSCKIQTTVDEDGELTTYTFDGNDLVKIVIKDDFGTYVTDFIYEGGKLKQVEEDENVIYEIVRTGGEVSKVNIKDYIDQELYGYLNYTRTNGKVTKLDVYEVYDAPESDTLIEQYLITYSGSNVKMFEILELGDSAKLESTETVSITGLDDKKNPFHLFPTLFSSNYDDPTILNANNLTSATSITPYGNLPYTIAYEYNSDGYPIKATVSELGETTVSTFSYNCN